MKPIRARKATAPNPVTMPTTIAKSDIRSSPRRNGRLSFISPQRA
jgi:hypothetical protein